ncbi:MAG: hypothetical protein M3Z56_04275 [Bacteroidota bacterium]|nr:hypothetical protein [Bacteroidota bacterium]
MDEIAKLNTKGRRRITDIDETILNNSPYEAHQTLRGKDYESSSGTAWIAKATADTGPRGFSFMKYAASKRY